MDLDHAGIIVPDLEAARGILKRCGFVMTAPERLMSAGGDGAKWSGGVNSVAMFEQGYLEIQEIGTAGAGHPLAGHAGRRGVEVLALGTGDAGAEWERLCRGGYAVDAPVQWSRSVRWGSFSGEAEFRFFRVPEELSSAAYTVIVEHLTPGNLRPEGITAQPNGVADLRAVVEVARDPSAALRRYHRLLGIDPNGDTNGEVVELERGSIELVDGDACLERYGQKPPLAEQIVALRLGVRDPRNLAGAMEAAGFDVASGPAVTLVYSRGVLGVDLELEVAL